MRVFVRAKPGASRERVEEIDNTHFEVWVKEPPVGGRANAAITKALAVHLGVAFSDVRLVSGHTSRQKVFKVI